MDDPLFIWAAKHISVHPGDPYGFRLNWYGGVTHMSEVTMNPPLACYYLAAAGVILGWSELALHAAFLLPTIAVMAGIYQLARHFCRHPLLASLVSFFTPVFLVSSTTVMCDVLMLAFWVWAILLWVEGLAREQVRFLIGSAFLITLAVLTKYFAISLVPLLGVFGVLRKRKLGMWTSALLIPLLALGIYHFLFKVFYGRAPLFEAATYGSEVKGFVRLLSLKSESTVIGLGFAGGGLAGIVLLLPMLWRKQTVAVTAMIVCAVVAILAEAGVLLNSYGPIQGSSRDGIILQLSFWALGGVGLLALAVDDIRCRNDADAWLLGLWVMGTFFFAAYFNWTVNGRTILPMVPAVAILVMRRLERRAAFSAEAWPKGFALAGFVGLLLSVWVAHADFRFASNARESARLTFAKYGIGPGRFWYQGHWGFQYYMDQFGAQALDAEHTPLQRGDLIATPDNNTNFVPLGPELVSLREVITVPGPRFLTTMKGEVGAGFYASSRGPLPFAFGDVPVDRVFVCAIDPPPRPSVTSPSHQ